MFMNRYCRHFSRDANLAEDLDSELLGNLTVSKVIFWVLLRGIRLGLATVQHIYTPCNRYKVKYEIRVSFQRFCILAVENYNCVQVDRSLEALAYSLAGRQKPGISQAEGLVVV